MLEARNEEGVVVYGSSAGSGLSTQTDMNQDAGLATQSARAQMEALQQQVGLRLNGSPRAAQFEQSSARFQEYLQSAGERAAAKFGGGAMARLAL